MSTEVLVVEDDDSIRKLIVLALRRAGLTVDEARDGSEAIERLSSTPYRLVIFDLMMPHVDGRALVASVRSMTAQRPRLILTTAACDSDVEELKAFVDAWFCKPFDILALVGTSTRLVASSHEGNDSPATPLPSGDVRPAA